MKTDKTVLAADVEKTLRDVYATWHCCSLPLRLVKKGSRSNKRVLCDDCSDSIAAHMKDLFAKASHD